PDERAIDLYRKLVGNTDETVARAMVAELDLEHALKAYSRAGDEPWEALHRMRLEFYTSSIATGEALRQAVYPHTLQVLRKAAAEGRATAVATSSFTEEALRVLQEIGVVDTLDVVVGRDRVARGKPHPEMYLKTAGLLGVLPGEMLVFEDSTVGVEAAVAAGAPCIAVANPNTQAMLESQTLLEQRWVVVDPADLESVVARRLMSAGDASDAAYADGTPRE
ncbi:MAG: HAD family hydrolase, partial [Chloroflexota bacterium]